MDRLEQWQRTFLGSRAQTGAGGKPAGGRLQQAATAAELEVAVAEPEVVAEGGMLCTEGP